MARRKGEKSGYHLFVGHPNEDVQRADSGFAREPLPWWLWASLILFVMVGLYGAFSLNAFERIPTDMSDVSGY